MNFRNLLLNLLCGAVAIVPASLLMIAGRGVFSSSPSDTVVIVLCVLSIAALLLLPNLIMWKRGNLALTAGNVLLALVAFLLPAMVLAAAWHVGSLREAPTVRMK